MDSRNKTLTWINGTVASVVWAEAGSVPKFPFTTHSTFPKIHSNRRLISKIFI